jgi:hypothetical protein
VLDEIAHRTAHEDFDPFLQGFDEGFLAGHSLAFQIVKSA